MSPVLLTMFERTIAPVDLLVVFLISDLGFIVTG